MTHDRCLFQDVDDSLRSIDSQSRSGTGRYRYRQYLPAIYKRHRACQPTR